MRPDSRQETGDTMADDRYKECSYTVVPSPLLRSVDPMIRFICADLSETSDMRYRIVENHFWCKLPLNAPE